MTGKTRTSPEVDEQLLDDLKTAIRVFNEGKLKGRLSPTFEEAIQLYLVVMYSRSPMRLKHLEDEIDPDELGIDDPDAYRSRILQYVSGVEDSLTEATQMLQRDSPGAQSGLERALLQANETGGPGSVGDQFPLDNSLVGEDASEQQIRRVVREEFSRMREERGSTDDDGRGRNESHV